MAPVDHFGCPKFTLVHTFLAILDQYRFFCLKFLTKWLPVAIHLISIHFTSIRNFNFFEILDKMADVGHFGCPNFYKWLQVVTSGRHGVNSIPELELMGNSNSNSGIGIGIACLKK